MRFNQSKVWSFWCFLLLSGLILLASSLPAQAIEIIQSDQAEYSIGDFAIITGTGFAAGVAVTIQVERVDGVIDSTEITTLPDGTFQYDYYLNPNAVPTPEGAYGGTLTVYAWVGGIIKATATFLDNPSYNLQGCSKNRGSCEDESVTSSGWADSMEGLTTGQLDGWYEQENIPFRLRMNLLHSSDGNKAYYIMTEHDNYDSDNSATGIDGASNFYVGAGPRSVYPEGFLTKTCVLRGTGTGVLPPTSGVPCYVSGPTYSGVDDDGNGGIDEDPVDGLDNDNDGKIDEDPPKTSAQPGRQIQYVWAIYYNSSEAGSANKRWCLYWKAHPSNDCHNYSTGRIHTHTSESGDQDVDHDCPHPASADLQITKTDSPDPVSAGGTLTYTLKVKNNGPDSASGVTVSDTLPVGTTYVPSLSGGTGWTCNLSSGVVTCTRSSSLGVGNAPNITVVVTAPSPGSPTSISNTATVTWSGTDPTSSNNSSTASTTVNAATLPNANLGITKTDSPDPVSSGGTLTYTVTVTNYGSSTAPTVTVTDTLPPEVTYGSATGSGWTCNQSSGVVTCTRTNLATGAAPVIIIVVTAPITSSPITITNTAAVAGSGCNDSDISNNTAVQQTVVSGIAELAIAKTASTSSVLVGGAFTYTVTVTNNGPSVATGVSVTDTLPSGTTYVGVSGGGWTCSQVSGIVTCSRASLAVVVGPAITISVNAPSTPGLINNTATVTRAEIDPNSGNDTATVGVTVLGSANLSITKTDSPDPVSAQGTLTYTIGVSNAGPNTATGVTVTDVLPSGTAYVSASGSGWTCNQNNGTVTCNKTSSLASGASASNITVTVTAPVNGGSISNTAIVSAIEGDPNTGNNSATAGTTVTGISNLSITKIDSSDPVTAGATFTYTITVGNVGPSIASTVTVTDTLPVGVGYINASGGAGWACSYDTGLRKVTCILGSLGIATAPAITLTVTAPSEGGSISNTATVSSTSTDPNPGNNSSTQGTTVTASANLSITKTDAPDPVVAGGTLIYTINVSNAGPSTASTVSVTDTLPTGVGYVSASGGGWTCSYDTGLRKVTCNLASLGVTSAPAITLTVTAPGTSGTISNTASVTSVTNDPNSGNNSSTASTSVTPSVDLSITKTDAPDPVVASQSLTYTLVVTNNGPSAATGVSVQDNLPSGTTFVSATGGASWSCSLSSGVVTCNRALSLAVGPAPDISIVVTAPAEGGSISNTATVGGNEGDPNGGNNSATASTVVTASVDLSITKTDSPDPVAVGQNLTYTLVVTNNGPSTATGVTVQDNLPSGTTFVSAIGGPDWSCSQSSGVVTCNRALSLAVGSAPDISIVVTAPGQVGSISNTATVSGNETDPNIGNNSATADTMVQLTQSFLISNAASGDQRFPWADYNATTGQYLVLWQDKRNGDTNDDIYGVRLDVNGNRIGSDFPVSTAPAHQQRVLVKAGGGGYLAVWHDLRNQATKGADIYGRWVNGNGTLGAEMAICSCTGDQWNPVAGYDPVSNSFLVVWLDTRGSGNNLTGNPNDDYDLYGVVIPAGGSGSLTPFPVVVANNGQRGPQIGYDYGNSRYYLAWNDRRDGFGPGYNIYGSRVTTSGALLDGTGTLLAGAADNQFRPTVTDRRPSAGINNHFIAWTDYRSSSVQADVFGVYVDGTGVVAGPEVAVSTSTANEANVVADVDWIRTKKNLVGWIRDQAPSLYFNVATGTVDQVGAVAGGSLLDSVGADQRANVSTYATNGVSDYGFLTVWMDQRNGSNYDIWGVKSFPN